MSSALQVEAFRHDPARPTPGDDDVLAHALNERSVELGGSHPVPSATDSQSRGRWRTW
jgi:hypothetical protein